MGSRRCFAPGPLRNPKIAFGSGRFASARPLCGAFRYGGGIPRGGHGARTAACPARRRRRVPPVDAVFPRACAPPGSVGIPPVAIRRAFAAHTASRAVRVACLLLAGLRASGPAVLLRCRRETPAPTHRHYIRLAPSCRKTFGETASRRRAKARTPLLHPLRAGGIQGVPSLRDGTTPSSRSLVGGSLRERR